MTTETLAAASQQMNIVIIGHVDHGKSTVIGRLLADTDSLPQGKLQEVRDRCAQNSKPFEYAFLLDALKDEQAQGITIDSARCFFKSAKREYIIIDAPGHIEFLKNMISGAARAEAAILVIDAKEGVQENSRRHGYLLSLLGIRQVIVAINKMDLVNYNQGDFERIKEEYTQFLNKVGIEPIFTIPVCAREGDCIISSSPKMPWYQGESILDAIDSFIKEPLPADKPFRFPVQDIYKFTQENDDRRIVAGRIDTGQIQVGDDVVFAPSGKRTKIASIESFNTAPKITAGAGESTGFTLAQQIYIQPGEIMYRADQQPARKSTQIQTNIFWMGRQPMITNKRYKLKIGSTRVPVWLREIKNVLDASELTTDSNKKQIERHDVAECVLETLKPIAFDLNHEIAQTGRFVIIDNYEIAGGGVIQQEVVSDKNMITESVNIREKRWDRSAITSVKRTERYNQRSTLVLISGPADSGKKQLAKDLEQDLFASGRFVYYLGISNALGGLDPDAAGIEDRDQAIRKLGEIAHLYTDAGLILITAISDLDDYELEIIKTLNQPNDCRVVNVGQSQFVNTKVDLQLAETTSVDLAIGEIKQMLAAEQYLIDYCI